MSRPTWRVVQVRAEDLKVGDVVQMPWGAYEGKWLTLSWVSVQDGYVRANTVEQMGAQPGWPVLDLVNVQEQLGDFDDEPERDPALHDVEIRDLDGKLWTQMVVHDAMHMEPTIPTELRMRGYRIFIDGEQRMEVDPQPFPSQ